MPERKLTRRQFLKLASLAGLSSLLPGRVQVAQDNPNILVVVFDAWSAKNISLYGYPRQTMPHLDELASRAVVYHNHYAGAPWTIPGTASLLTGTYPWTHRAFTAAENKTLPEFEKQNIFSMFQAGGYFTRSYSHNAFADQLLYQFGRSISEHIPRKKLFLSPYFSFSNIFPKDPDAAAVAELRAFLDDGAHSSIFLEQLLRSLTVRRREQQTALYGDLFPEGLPATPVPEMAFLLEEGINYLLQSCADSAEPYFSYFHFYPPHQPYHTRSEFDNAFKKDGIVFNDKPRTIINEGVDENGMVRERQHYDEFLLYVDSEFDRFYRDMERFGLLKNTWLVLTTDHGEMFERGNVGHEVPTGVDPAIHIPLLIFPPGQQERVDVFEYTSAVDVLPTLLKLAGLPEADWAEGAALPPFSSSAPLEDRSIYCYHPEDNRSRRAIKEGAATIIKDQYKLISTFGIPSLGKQDPYLELYDLESDPEELENLIDTRPEKAESLLQELQDTIAAADSNFRH